MLWSIYKQIKFYYLNPKKSSLHCILSQILLPKIFLSQTKLKISVNFCDFLSDFRRNSVKSGKPENQGNSEPDSAMLRTNFVILLSNSEVRYQHVPPASVPPRDDHSDPRINQVAGRGRVSDFGENRTKISKIRHRGGENRDLS